MKSKADRIKSLAKTFALTLEQERRACQDTVLSLMEMVGALQGDTADRRFRQLITHLKKLQERFDLLVEMAGTDFLAKIERDAEELNRHLVDNPAIRMLTELVEIQPPSLNLLCQSLLDHLVEATGAERGFFVSYLPESTEANIIAAHNYQTTNLLLEEYSFSRTILQEVFQCGKPILLEDASGNPKYSNEASIKNFRIRSVLAVPMTQDYRAMGAFYLANDTIACAFGEEDLRFLESMARFTVSYFHSKRLLPLIFEHDSRIFFDAGKASREIIGQNPKIVELIDLISRIADSTATVLIEGESGTGKELVARALHYQSTRRDHPFVAINCAAIPEHLLESELFGYERGAFTGAVERYCGRIEQGQGGTIFLDEISELAYPLQAKLLRFLQSKEFQRLGGKETIQVDVRVVAATSKNLKAMMEAGKFQEALYYRLNVIPLRIPPLRERKEEIPLLVDHFLNKFSSVYQKTVRMEAEVYEYLKEYPFLGNVRELENMIHRMVVLALDDLLRLGDLPPEVLQISSKRVSLKKEPLYKILNTLPVDFKDLSHRRKEIRRLFAEQERRMVEQAVQEASGNITEAAGRLGAHRSTLHKAVGRKK